MNLQKCTHQGSTIVRQILQRAFYKKQMNFAKRAVSKRDPKDSIGAVFGFDWRSVRIRMARCADSIGAVFGFATFDKQMLQRASWKSYRISQSVQHLESGRSQGFDLARCLGSTGAVSDSTGAVFGFDSRGVRIRHGPLINKC